MILTVLAASRAGRVRGPKRPFLLEVPNILKAHKLMHGTIAVFIGLHGRSDGRPILVEVGVCLPQCLRDGAEP